MTRYYLQPGQLAEVIIAGLDEEAVRRAIERHCENLRVADEAEQAAKILRQAGVPVNEDSLARLRKLVR